MGWLYVADLHNNRVQCFDAERVFRASIAPVGLVAPFALAVSHSLDSMGWLPVRRPRTISGHELLAVRP